MITLPAALGFLMPAAGGATTYVSSVQLVEITLTAATSNTATITSVNTANSFIVFLGETTNITAQNGATVQTRVELTNGTTVTASRNTGTNNVTARAIVVECTASLVNSVQHGTVSIAAGTSGTATITAVTTATAAVFYLGESTTSTSTIASWASRLTLTNSTTVTANVNSSTTATVGFCVVDFNAAAIQSIQQVSTTSTSVSTTMTSTISSVTTTNAFMAYGGQTNANANYGNLFSADLTNATTVTWTRNGASANSRTCNATVIELKSGVLNSSVQRATSASVNATSTDVTVTSVVTNKSVTSWLFWNSSSSQPNTGLETAKLFNATTMRFERNTAGGTTVNTSWEIAEFK